jgi:enoyl-CoA hydratase/carnithine racemase
MTPVVRVEHHGDVDRLTLDAPATRNALSLQMLDDLAAAVGASAVDNNSRGLVIDHTGPVFCAGVDVKERRSLAPGSRNPSEVLASLYASLWAYPKPVLCRVAGPARGGGIGFAACADAVVATADASFAFSEVRIGVAPALVGAMAMAKLGPGRLAPWLLTGQAFGVADAAAIGLVTHVAAGDGSDELEGLVDSLRLAAPGSVLVTKALVRRFTRADVPALITEMTTLSAQLFDGAEAREGMAAFADKREASWAIR